MIRLYPKSAEERKAKLLKNPHFDESTGLHSFLHHMPELISILENQKALGLIYIDTTELGKIEHDYGHQVYSEVLQKVVHTIEDLKGHMVRAEDILSIRHPGDEQFLLFLSAQRSEYTNFLKVENLRQIIDRFLHSLNARLLKLTFPYTKKILKTDIGYSYAVHNPLHSPERTVYRLIDQAKGVARFNGEQFVHQINEDLKEIIIEENIRTVYQPIIDLSDGSVFAYEALTRGPEGSPMESPLMLFGVADQTNLSFELDRLCRRKAIENVRELSPNQKLFVNTFPATMHDPEFKGEHLDKLLSQNHLTGDNIVLEVTERFAIENYDLFHREQAYYIDRGFQLAVDDIGSGYGSLEAIANLRPQYVKVDLSIIRNIHENDVKKELLRAICDIGHKIKAKILVEGVEKKEELEVVKAFGVDYAQGFLFARPASELLPKDIRIKV